MRRWLAIRLDFMGSFMVLIVRRLSQFTSTRGAYVSWSV